MKKVMVIIISLLLVEMISGMGNKAGAEDVETGIKSVSEVAKPAAGTEAIHVTMTGKKIDKERIIRENKKLKFIDKAGQIKKEIDLNWKKEKAKIGKEIVEKLLIHKLAAISDNEEYAVRVTNYYHEESKPGVIEVYDKEGNILWKRDMERGRGPSIDENIQCANNGIIAIRTNILEGEEGKLTIFDKTGKIIFELPTKELLERYAYCEPMEYKLSSDGKYIGVSFSVPAPLGSTLIFFNIKTGKSYDLGKDYGISYIKEDGKTKIIYQREVRIIDLKEKLGD